MRTSALSSALVNVALVTVAASAGLTACSSSTESGATEQPTAVTLAPLDDVVVTVAPEDLSGEVIVIADGSSDAPSTDGETTISVSPALEEAGIEPEKVDTELNPLGGDDPEDKRMPDVVCMDLQAAQNEIQDHGVFFSKSEDASGKGRRQLWDRNWVVVEQSPAPGEPIGEREAVLSVVKDGEESSC